MLVLAAGAEGKVRSYCQGLVDGDGDDGAMGAGSTTVGVEGATTDGN